MHRANDSTVERPGEVWYDSPFGPPQWMSRSQAKRLLTVEAQKFERMRELSGNDLLLYPPRVVARAERLKELKTAHRGTVAAINAEIDRVHRSYLRTSDPAKQGRVRMYDWYVIDMRTNRIVACVRAGERASGVTDEMADRAFMYVTKFPTSPQLDAYLSE